MSCSHPAVAARDVIVRVVKCRNCGLTRWMVDGRAVEPSEVLQALGLSVIAAAEGPLPPPAFPIAETLSTSEVARIFRVSTRAVGYWGTRGQLPSFRTPGGQLRFRREDVEELARKKGAL